MHYHFDRNDYDSDDDDGGGGGDDDYDDASGLLMIIALSLPPQRHTCQWTQGNQLLSPGHPLSLSLSLSGTVG